MSAVMATPKESLGVGIPDGMSEVSREQFWKSVMSSTLNIGPSPRRETCDWMVLGTAHRWGWVSNGYASPHDNVPRYALANGGAA